MSGKVARAKAGFTILELVTVVSIVAITLSLGVVVLGNLKGREEVRERSRGVMALLQRARSTALALGPAAGTGRASLGPTCAENGIAPAFQRSGNRVAVLIQPGATLTCSGGTTTGCCPNGGPCDLVTLVTQVDRQASTVDPWAGDDFILHCKTYEVGPVGRPLFDPLRFQNFRAGPLVGGLNTFFLDYDARGFALIPAGLAARVGMLTPTGMANPGARGLLVLGSGIACPEGNDLSCLRN